MYLPILRNSGVSKSKFVKLKLIHQLQLTFLFHGQEIPPPLAYCDSELSLEWRVLRGMDKSEFGGSEKITEREIENKLLLKVS